MMSIVLAEESITYCFLQVIKGKATDAVSLLATIFPTLNYQIREDNLKTLILAKGNPDEVKKLRKILTTLSVAA